MPVKLFVGAIIAVCLVGCSKLSDRDLIGVYTAEYEGGKDALELRSNGSYSHRYLAREQNALNVGTWKFDPVDGAITFEGFQFRGPARALKPSGVWIVVVDQTLILRTPRLCFDPDLYKCFDKE